MDKEAKEKLELRLESLKNISESYSMKKCLEDLEGITEMLDRGEETEVLEKIREIEKQIRKKVEEGAQ